jgi:uncharacterized membrane protein
MHRTTGDGATPKPAWRIRLGLMKRSTGIILGIGLGGFIDGIVLHQILHWHNMGSAVMPPITMAAMRQNMRWDGYFHLTTLVITFVGILLLWRDGFRREAMPPLSAFIGQMILGGEYLTSPRA